MTPMTRCALLLALCCTCLAPHARAAEDAPAPQPTPAALPDPPPFRVRAGYQLTVAATDLRNPRFMEFDDKGVLYVSDPGAGKVISLKDADADGFYDMRGVFAQELSSVHGLCFSGGWMWMSTSGAVFKARDLDGDGQNDEIREVLKPGSLPRGGGHWWRSLLVTKDAIYTSIGDTGNITDETDTPRQKVWRFSIDGSAKALFASGIRNTEKLRIRPGTEEIWGIDHGSDNFGQSLGEQTGSKQPITDFNPPDELNLYTQDGFYGHPFITGLKLPRYEFSKRRDIVDLAQRTTPPQWCFPAHSAANSFCFIDTQVNARTGAFPPDHGGDMFVACRGSWNRVEKSGYQILRVLFDPLRGKPYGSLEIVSTLSPSYGVVGRPVDCAQAPDGSVLFTCDHTASIYRIRGAQPK